MISLESSAVHLHSKVKPVFLLHRCEGCMTVTPAQLWYLSNLQHRFVFLSCLLHNFLESCMRTLITPNLQNSLTLSRTTHSRLLLADPKKGGVLVCVSVCHEADWPRHLSSPRPVISLCNSDECQTMSSDKLLQTSSLHNPPPLCLLTPSLIPEQREHLKVPGIHFSDTVKGIFYTFREHKHTS